MKSRKRVLIGLIVLLLVGVSAFSALQAAGVEPPIPGSCTPTDATCLREELEGLERALVQANRARQDLRVREARLRVNFRASYGLDSSICNFTNASTSLQIIDACESISNLEQQIQTSTLDILTKQKDTAALREDLRINGNKGVQ